LFTGKELDEDTGLYYFGARYYDARTSVWVSVDPILGSYLDAKGNGGVFNSHNLGLYTYGYNNPITYFDPDGKLNQKDWVRIQGGLVALGGGFETSAGVALGVSTSWTGVGAVAGGVVALHGADQFQAGIRQLITGEETDSLTSTGLQKFGMSRDNSNIIDMGISLVGGGVAGTTGGTRLFNMLSKNFASPAQLSKHFLKHAAEWGGKMTELNYLNKARSLLASKVGGNILGFTSKEGTIFRYNKVSNEFATMKPNGVIETLFRPKEGMKYYLEQVAKYGNQ